MVLTFKTFESEINKISVFEKKSRIAVGVSGGVDSIVLVSLLSKWSQLKKYKIIALIIDHKLRTESSLEAKKVSNYLSKLKIENIVLEWKKNKNIKSIQKSARTARLKIFQNYCNKNNILHLFLGHNENDNLETYILRKIGASGTEGLKSIKSLTIYKNIQIIRPLLKFNRKKIENYANKNNLTWIEDPSNKNMFFSRIKIRSIMLENPQIKNLIKKKYIKDMINSEKYLEMINYNLSLLITKVNYSKIEIDKYLFKKLPRQIALKIIAISIKFVNKKDFTSRYKKLDIIYSKLVKKTLNFRSQSTYFTNGDEKIIISAIK